MKLKKNILLVFISLFLTSCVSLQPVQVTKNDALEKYTYFFITPTEPKTGSSGGIYWSPYGIFNSSSSKSTNPADIISGYLIKKGLIRLPEIKSELAEKTMIINYAETGRRTAGLGYAIEITLQIVSAETNQVICTLIGEGYGDTEADDIRIAINRCLEEMYRK